MRASTTSTTPSRSLAAGAGTTSRPSYEELEDSLYRLREDHESMKRRANEQDQKLKTMSTRIARGALGAPTTTTNTLTLRGGGVAGVEEAQGFAAMREQLAATGRENEALRRKLQLERLRRNQESPRDPYSHVKARVDTGLAGSDVKRLIPLLGAHVRVSADVRRGAPQQRYNPRRDLAATTVSARIDQGAEDDVGSPPQPPVRSARTQTMFPDIVQQNLSPEKLLEFMRVDLTSVKLGAMESAALVDLVHFLVRKVISLEEEARRRQEELNAARARLVVFEEGKDRDFAGSSGGDAQTRLQEALAQHHVLKSKNDSLEETLKNLKESYGKTLEEYAKINELLAQEKVKSSKLELELKKSGGGADSTFDLSGTPDELNQIIEDLRSDKAQLQELLNKYLEDLTKKDANYDSERASYTQRIAQLQERLSEEEEEAKRAAEQCQSFGQKYEQAMKELQSQQDDLAEEKRRVQAQVADLQQKLEVSDGKLKLLMEEAGTELGDIERALAYLRTRKEQPVDDVDKLRKALEEQQMASEQMAHEIDKLRALLAEQDDINARYKRELSDKSAMSDTLRQHYEERLSEQGRVLDVKRDLIKKLEGQVDAVMRRPQAKCSAVVRDEASLSLLDDENAVELFISKVSLAPEYFEDDVEIFVVFDFFDYETIVTPALQGRTTDPRFTVFFKTKVDAFFLHYLKTFNVVFEVYKAVGTDFSLIGTCVADLRELLVRTDKIVATTEVVSSQDNATSVGSMRYTLRTVRPMDAEIRIFSMREQALAQTGHASEGSRPTDGVASGRNQVDVSVMSCSGLPTCSATGRKPSPFASYQFLDFPDVFTATVPATCEPVFNDVKAFPIPVTAELEEYVVTKELEFVVCDDNDDAVSSTSAGLIGVARVPLLPLIRDQVIQGQFALLDHDGRPAGTINLSISWKFPFARKDAARFPPKPIASNRPVPSVHEETVAAERPETSTARTESAVVVPSEGDYEEEDEQETPDQEPLQRTGRQKKRSAPIPPLKTPSSKADSLKRSQLSPVRLRSPRESLRAEQAFEGLAIAVSIHKLDLLPAILHNPMLEKIGVALEFLQAPSDPMNMFTEFRAASSSPFAFDFKREFSLSDYNYRIRLFAVMTSGHRSDASVIFDVCNKVGGQLHIIGSAELCLHSILAAKADLVQAELEVLDISMVKVGTLWVTVEALASLQAVLDHAQTVTSSLPTVSLP